MTIPNIHYIHFILPKEIKNISFTLVRYMEEDHYMKCNCKNLCERTDFETRVSTAVFPARHILKELKTESGVTEEYIRYICDSMIYIRETPYTTLCGHC